MLVQAWSSFPACNPQHNVTQSHTFLTLNFEQPKQFQAEEKTRFTKLSVSDPGHSFLNPDSYRDKTRIRIQKAVYGSIETA